MTERVIAKRPAPKIAPVEGLFDAKNSIKSSHTGELVIALCGPIGSPIHKVGEMIKSRLKDDFAYDECEIIRLSTFIAKHSVAIPDTRGYPRKKALIDAGDNLRKEYGASILAEFAVNQIAMERQKAKAAAGGEIFKPRRICHIIDSIKNQEELDVLQLVYRDMLYFVGVYAPLPSRVKEMEKGGLSNSDIFALIDRDSGEELDHGQTVRDTFPLADFFLRIDSDTDTQIKAKVERFLHLILGTKVLTPTYSETAMYVAASAAGNSACLSRQVGASICDRDGEILAVGWNDVPRPDGGLYMADHKVDPNSEKDKRCWNIDGGICFNDQEKEIISEFVVGELVLKGVVSAANKKTAISIVANSKVKTLIEFSRSIHAEMHAILTAGHLAGNRIKGSALYCTTYPCHACARHIIAAGISEVYYIEPYRKSLATKLHADAITEDESDTKKVRILPYDGVSPNRYLKLFRVPSNSRKSGGKMISIDPKKAAPRFDKTLEALPQLEALVVKGLEAKNVSIAKHVTSAPAGANDA